MAFNLGGFVGGAASAVTERIRVNEDRMQKRLEESRRDARALRLRKAAERDAEKKSIKDAIGALTFVGYTPDQAAEIAAKGTTTADLYLDVGKRSFENGTDVSKNYGMRTVDSTEELSDIADAAAPATGTSFGGFSAEFLQETYRKPDATSNSFGARLAVLSQKQLATNDPNKIADYERQKTALLKDLNAMKEAESIKGADEKGPTFTLGTIQSNVNSAVKQQLVNFDLGMDMEGNIRGKIEGKEVQVEVARLRAADYLNRTFTSLEDPVMTDAVSALQAQAATNLTSYKNAIVSQVEAGQTVERYKTVANEEELNSKINTFNIGDIISLPNVGTFVYTQIVNPVTGKPFY
jgi:hypothetical protein